MSDNSTEDELRDDRLDFYQELRERVRTWVQENGEKHEYADYVLLAPDLFHVLCRLSVDGDVPPIKKAKVAGAIAYFVSPVDVVPEAVSGPAGYVDDVALSAHVLDDILNEVDEEVIQRHWAGDENILDVIQSTLEMADEMLGSGLWNQVKNAI
jgi:uncharacterized membrane protein YkvA (DUF1232 family)